ncbi:hypothetical protein [Foetidibacter luteolus]|uniref:hypothetical protein n=1 Tax=Foetidibacter luteolus TaxID=2608880 RepID=UPI00129ADCF4|nr:hypothetical protein [Foetidibacter luteolus]
MKKLIILALPALLSLAGCSSTKVTDSWSDNTEKPALKKILVLGLFNDKDRNTRMQMEEQLAEDLRAYGYDAVTSFNAYGPKSFGNMSEDKALKMLRNSGIDGVVTITLLDKSKERNYVPGNMAYNPYPYRRFWGYYSYYYPRVYQPGYYETNTNYYFETNLYNIDNNKLLYSAQSQSFDPSSTRVLADEYAKTIVKDLKKKNIIG